MSRMRLLNKLKPEQITFEGFCLIRSCAIKTNVKGASYLDLTLADCEGEAVAKKWEYDPLKDGGPYESEDIVKVRGLITEFKGAEQLKIDKIRLATEEDKGTYDLNDLIPCAPFDPEWMFDELYALTERFTDGDLKLITQYLLKTNRTTLLRAPAAVKLHHATCGGLLQHCREICEMASGILKTYPALDSDLVYAGAILHDIGKLEELSTGKLGIASAYSTEGQLLGHITIGVNLIGETGHLLGISEETILLLQHMLLSHHGQAEFGSPKPPMFPEAEVLSELDLLSSRLYGMYDALENVQPGAFSDRIWSLDNRMLYQRKLPECHGASAAGEDGTAFAPATEEGFPF